MSKHTPGPWKAWDSPAGEYDPNPTWTVSDLDGNDICTAEDVTDGTAEGNARLIAAAPDLLAALEEMYEQFGNLEYEYVAEKVACMNARDAIARAKGEQS